ncbi:MAG: 6-phosphofructokinase [Planctomycetes bacterium]|nr:6-phosphofructokinase [Planctomycetota bacterium]
MPLRVGILTGGGDCPGLNAVIRAVARTLVPFGYRILGFRNGWKGVLDRDVEPLSKDRIAGILHVGGTILGTSRTNPRKRDDGLDSCAKCIDGLGLKALIAIGGEDTLGVASELFDQFKSPVIGVPKTIDNDLCGTDQTFGFDTAVQIATEAIDRLHSTAESHRRVMIVEVMGRNAGWIALHAGVAGGADYLLIPEFPEPLEDICESLRVRFESGKRFSLVVVSEGATLKTQRGQTGEVYMSQKTDEFGHKFLGGVSNTLSEQIIQKTGYETRVTILGHVQRGGTPTAFDRVLATRYGYHAAQMVLQQKWGSMASLQGTAITDVPLKDAVARTRTVPRELYEMAKALYG